MDNQLPLESPEAREPEGQEWEAGAGGPEQSEEKRPALVINIHSWATPIVAAVALVLGLLIGYLARPALPSIASKDAPAVASNPTAATDQSSTVAEIPQGAPTESIDQAATRQQVMDFLTGLTKHFKGDPAATVTMIEFSDYQ